MAKGTRVFVHYTNGEPGMVARARVMRRKQISKLIKRLGVPPGKRVRMKDHDDVKERANWGNYMNAYKQMLAHTSTHAAPWYVIPADHKWFSRLAVAAILWQRMHDLNLAFPRLNDAKLEELQEVRRLLMAEPD